MEETFARVSGIDKDAPPPVIPEPVIPEMESLSTIAAAEARSMSGR